MKFYSFLHAACLLSVALLTPAAWAQEKEAVVPKITITTEVFPEGAGSVTGGGSKPTNSFALLPHANAGYGFLYWSLNGMILTTNSSLILFNATNETVVANFGFLVTTTSSTAKGGITTGGGAFTNGASVTVTAIPVDCYTFVNWTKGAKVLTNNQTYTFTVAAGEALTANFKQIQYTNTTLIYPPKSGTVTGGGPSLCGATITLTAHAATGFKFGGWLINGVVGTRTNLTYTFITEGNQTITAEFADDQIPTIAISSFSVMGSLLTVSGTAKDNTGVGCVFYALNGNPASAAGLVATTTNGYTNWTATAILPPGKNVFYALAVDSSANLNQSKTVSNSIPSVSTNLAPIALAGLVAQVTPEQLTPAKALAGQNPSFFQVSFGTATYAQFGSSDTNQGSRVGNYTYTQTSSSTAELVLNSFAPANQGGSNNVVELTFSSPTSATYSSGNDAGSITLSPGLTTPLTSAEGRNATSIDITGDTTNYTEFGDGTFSSINNLGTNIGGSFTFTQVGPGAALLVQVFTNLNTQEIFTNYVVDQVLATGQTTSGNYFVTTVTSLGDGPYFSSGTFTSTNRPSKTAYLAPETLNGYSATVTQTKPAPAQPSFNVTFGQATMAQTTSNTNNKSRVSNYTYTRTGAKTAVLNISDYLPPSNGDGGNNGNPIYLTFTSPTALTFDDPSGPSSGTITATVLPQSSYFAPITLSGRTLIVANSKGSTTVVFGADGTFSETSKTGSNPGTYTFAQYTPDVVMFVANHTDGEVDYIQLTFSSSNAGSVFFTKVTGTTKTEVGTFTLK